MTTLLRPCRRHHMMPCPACHLRRAPVLAEVSIHGPRLTATVAEMAARKTRTR